MNSNDLAVRFLKMPFDEMLEVFLAIDELDEYILARLEDERSPNLESWKIKVAKRRHNRQLFIEMRAELEGGMSPSL